MAGATGRGAIQTEDTPSFFFPLSLYLSPPAAPPGGERRKRKRKEERARTHGLTLNRTPPEAPRRREIFQRDDGWDATKAMMRPLCG
jgi:hypothetical protein